MSVRIRGTAVRSETCCYSLSYSENSESVVILSETVFVSRRTGGRRAINFAFFAKLQNRAFGALPY
jgi:hypothetical protein